MHPGPDQYTMAMNTNNPGPRAMRTIRIFAPWILRCMALVSYVPTSALGQNLVPNPGFEELLQCPTGPSQLAGTAFWFDPTGNMQGTPDLFHSCTSGTHSTPVSFLGFQEPADGEGHAGIFLYEGSQVLANWREYLQVELLEELVAHKCYLFSVLANLADNSSRTTDALGVRFYQEAVLLPNAFPPGDEPHLELPPGTFLNTTDWTPLEGTYIASGGERYLMIGNYRNNANTTVQQLSTNGNFAYAFIDAVSLEPCIPTSAHAPPSHGIQLIMGADGFEILGAGPGAQYSICDPLGRILQIGRIAGSRLDPAVGARGMIMLTILDGDGIAHFKVFMP